MQKPPFLSANSNKFQYYSRWKLQGKFSEHDSRIPAGEVHARRCTVATFFCGAWNDKKIAGILKRTAWNLPREAQVSIVSSQTEYRFSFIICRLTGTHLSHRIKTFWYPQDCIQRQLFPINFPVKKAPFSALLSYYFWAFRNWDRWRSLRVSIFDPRKLRFPKPLLW